MGIYSSAHLFSCFIYLGLALYILIKNPEPLVKRLCAAFVGSLSIWSFVNVYIHDVHASMETARIFSNIGSPGWIGFSSIFLWFVLVFSGKKNILKKRSFYILLLGLPLFLIGLQWAGLLAKSYVKHSYGWRMTWGDSHWAYLYFIYYLSFMSAGLILLFQVMRQSGIGLKQKQARIIFFCTLVSLCAGTVTDVLLPVFKVDWLPTVADLFGLLWASGMVYAMARYKFLAIAPAALKRSETVKDVLLNITEAALHAGSLQQLLKVIQRQVAELMDSRNFYVALVHDREMAVYTFPFIVDINPEELVGADEKYPLPNSYTDYVLRTEKPLLADEKIYHQLEADEEVCLIGTKPKAWLGVPLKTSEEVIGVVVVQSYSDDKAYSEGDMEILSIISNTIAGAIKYKQSGEALRESEDHYRTLVNNIQDGVFLIQDLHLEFVNDAFARILGYGIDEVMEKTFPDLIAPVDLKMVVSRYERRMKGESVPSEYEFSMRHKDGSNVFVNMQIGLLKYKDHLASMGTIKDITKQKQAEKERIRLEEELARSRKMEAIGQLAGGVAHDLNNVLSAIVSYPDLLLLKLPPDSPYRKSISIMQKSGQKAAAIVQDLLTLARRGVHVTKSVRLNSIVREYLSSPEFKKLTIFHPGVSVETELDETLSYIKGSAVHLSKTVMNLVSNATEAISGQGRVTIKTFPQIIDQPLKGYYQTIETGSYAVITVSDTGSGIGADDLEHIFDPFYTKKEMGRSGTGLGMSVVWGTVEDHKGYIDVGSIEGKGTQFTLYFPVTREEPLTDEITVPVEAFYGKREKILVVDDDLDQQEIATVLLNELNYSVERVSSGEEAIGYIKKNNVDMLLLDMIMSHGIDGLDTYKAIQDLKPGTKAVIVSGFSESERVKEALELGACSYIKKPYTLMKIGKALHRHLSGKK